MVSTKPTVPSVLTVISEAKAVISSLTCADAGRNAAVPAMTRPTEKIAIANDLFPDVAI